MGIPSPVLKTKCEYPHTAPSLEFRNDGWESVSSVDVIAFPLRGTATT